MLNNSSFPRDLQQRFDDSNVMSIAILHKTPCGVLMFGGRVVKNA
jgi:hypothetical protein